MTKPEEKPKDKLCPNCQTPLNIEVDKPNEAYCTLCDITYHLQKGKVHFEAGNKKGKIQELEEKIADQEYSIQKIVKKLFGQEEGEKDLWMD